MYLEGDPKKIDIKLLNQYQFLLFEDIKGNAEYARRIPVTFTILNPENPNFKGTVLIGTHKFPSCSEAKSIFIGLIDDKGDEILPRFQFEYFSSTEYIFNTSIIVNEPEPQTFLQLLGE